MERIIDGIPPTLEGWVYIIPIHGPLYTWAQYTPTHMIHGHFRFLIPLDPLLHAYPVC